VVATHNLWIAAGRSDARGPVNHATEEITLTREEKSLATEEKYLTT
jgi:hypothetical protein